MAERTLNLPLIASVGVHIVDILARHVSEIPAGQGIALVDEIRITAAGTAAGTSVDLAKLGCNVVAIGAIGKDDVGTTLVNLMSMYGIDTSKLVRKAEFKTSATMLPIRPNGDRPALHMLGANASFCADDVPKDTIRSCAFVHVGGTFLMPKFDGEGALTILKLAKESNATTSMDVLGIPNENMAALVLPYMPFLDFFMPNIEEAQMITGLSNVDYMADVFLSAGAGVVIFKMGPRGAYLKTKSGSIIRVPAYKVNVVDTTGCGDGWSAGFLAALCRGFSLEDAAKFGSACGSLVATGLGSDAGIIDWDRTISFMQNTTTLPLCDT